MSMCVCRPQLKRVSSSKINHCVKRGWNALFVKHKLLKTAKQPKLLHFYQCKRNMRTNHSGCMDSKTIHSTTDAPPKKYQKTSVFLDFFKYSSIWGQSHMASFDTSGNPAFQYLFLIFLYDSATWWNFLTFLKLKLGVTFIDLTCIKVTISLFIARMAEFSK